MGHDILVVDDERQVRTLLRRKMEQCGHRVEEAGDGAEAIDKLDESRFDLVISDILMPEKDGLELIMHLRSHQPEIKIIAMSAPGNQLFLDSAKALGALAVFEKPFALDEMADAVDGLLEGQPAH